MAITNIKYEIWVWKNAETKKWEGLLRVNNNLGEQFKLKFAPAFDTKAEALLYGSLLLTDRGVEWDEVEL